MYEKEFEIARKAVTEAGNMLASIGGHVLVCSSDGRDIKLKADKDSEKIIVDYLKEFDYPILSEEVGEILGGNEKFRWIVDPLDGTANYSRGIYELSCVSVALWRGNEPVFGVVNRFAAGEIYSGIIGDGAWKNDIPIKVSDVCEVPKAILATGFPLKRDYSSESLLSFIKSAQTFKKVRMLGSAAIMGALVAEGKVDAYMEEHIMLWDVAASAAIVMAAGGAADIKLLKNNECICTLFANDALRREYINICAQGI